MTGSRLKMAALAAVSMALISAGCGGGGAKVEAQTTTTTTMGQELMDLDAAYNKGIIDQEQYEASKNVILKRHKK